MSAMALAMTDSGKQLQRAECNKLKEGDEVYCWSDTNSTWSRTSFIRVCSDNANIVRLQAQKSVAAQHVFTKVERQGCHDLAPAVAVSDASAASGAMHVDQDEEVADEMRLHEFQNTLFVPWLQRLSVAEFDALCARNGQHWPVSSRKSECANLTMMNVVSLTSSKNKFHDFPAPTHLMSSLQQHPRVLQSPRFTSPF